MHLPPAVKCPDRRPDYDVPVSLVGLRIRLPTESWRPGVDEQRSSPFEVADVAGYDGHSMDDRCRRDQGVTFRTPIRNVELGALESYCRIDWQDSSFEGRQDMALHPDSQNRCLRLIAAFERKNAEFNLQ